MLMSKARCAGKCVPGSGNIIIMIIWLILAIKLLVYVYVMTAFFYTSRNQHTLFIISAIAIS